MSWEEREAIYDKHCKGMINTLWATAFNYTVWGGLGFVWVCYAASLILRFLRSFDFNGFLFVTIGSALLLLAIALPVILLPKKIIAVIGEAPHRYIRQINEKRETQNHELWASLRLDDEE